MKRFIMILFLLSFLGCEANVEESKVLARINNYKITKAEFDEEFKESPFGKNDNPEARKEFLHNLENRKLILLDAQAQGLDKEKTFLRRIESFWEQSLLKIAIEKKTKELYSLAVTSDGEIKEAYDNMFKEGKTDKQYKEIYDEIKWILTKEKQSKLLDEWLENLRNNADIQVNYDLLNEK